KSLFSSDEYRLALYDLRQLALSEEESKQGKLEEIKQRFNGIGEKLDIGSVETEEPAGIQKVFSQRWKRKESGQMERVDPDKEFQTWEGYSRRGFHAETGSGSLGDGNPDLDRDSGQLQDSQHYSLPSHYPEADHRVFFEHR